MTDELFCIICDHQEFSHKSDGTLVKHNHPKKDKKTVEALLCSKCGNILSAKTQDIPWNDPRSVFENIQKRTVNGYTRKS